MIIGKRRLKQIKLLLVSPLLEKTIGFGYLVMLPLIIMYDQIGLDYNPVDLIQMRSYFQFNIFEACSTNAELIDYLEQTYAPQYFSRGYRSKHIPLQHLIVAQQRVQDQNCNSTFIDCYYYGNTTFKNLTKPEDPELCNSENCSEFELQNNFLSSTYISGHYQNYEDFNYFFNIHIDANLSRIFENLKRNRWLDSNTEALLIMGSFYDIKSTVQVQLMLLVEMNQGVEALYAKEFIHQLPAYDLSDQIHMTLLVIFMLVGLIKLFRTLLELTYIFSRYNLMYFIYNFVALLIFMISKFMILITRNSPQTEFLIFPQSLVYEYIGQKIVSPKSALEVVSYQDTEDFGKILLLLSYPYAFLQFTLLFLNLDWVQSYHCLSMRTLPGLVLCSFLALLVYFLTFVPLHLLDLQNRPNHKSRKWLLYLIIRVFIDDDISEMTSVASVFTMLSKTTQFVFFIMLSIYAIGLSIEAFRKASIIEMPYQTRYEKEYLLAYESLNLKLKKVLKQVFNIYVKERQQREKEQRQKDKQSKILEDDENLSTELGERINQKILIVFEIRNQYLEEINRLKAKRENQIHIQKKDTKKNTQGPKIGAIIQQLLRNKGNQKLQVMLRKYQGQDPAQNQSNEEMEDFFLHYTESIQEAGVTIRSFEIIFQVMNFLEMLLKLRPEYLSLNAEQRIRIMFYIHSDQVEEEDVYKLLSFLIVSLHKHHLNYPILVYSQHKEWQIDKVQYLKLKKFYRNIFSTQDRGCAHAFCLMNTSFVNFQALYSKDQQFHEKENLEDISNSILDEDNEKSVLI